MTIDISSIAVSDVTSPSATDPGATCLMASHVAERLFGFLGRDEKPVKAP